MGKKSGTFWTGVLLLLALVQHMPQSMGQGPSVNDVCSGVNCQQGTCVPALLGFSCKCQEGWGNILEVPFLPCGIPINCHINYTCDGKAEAPAPPPPEPTLQLPNLTTFNPCTFSLCGFGKCVPRENPGFLTIPYSCKCDPGNSNVLNMTSGICLPNCNFGGSCSQLGLPLSGSSSPPPPAIVTSPPSAGLYPPGEEPGQTGTPSYAGKRSTEIASFLASFTVGATVWLWI